jgi:hypothetical protein
MSRLPFFYGWVMLPAVMLVSICTSPGQPFGIAVFNPYLRQALGLSNSELSGAYMAGTMLAALPLIYIGALRRQNSRRPRCLQVLDRLVSGSRRIINT